MLSSSCQSPAYILPEEAQVKTTLDEVHKALEAMKKEISPAYVDYMNSDGICQLEYGDLVIKIGSKTALPVE